MSHARKMSGLLFVSAVVMGSFFFAPDTEAYINVKNIQKPAAPSREQEQTQVRLAEQARDLARQYENRRFGTGEEDPLVAAPAMEQKDGTTDATDNPSPQERMTATQSASQEAQAVSASVRTEPVARNLPKLPGSGFGLPIAALALGAAGALRGRKEMA